MRRWQTDWQNKFHCTVSWRREASSFNSMSLSHSCQIFTQTQTKLQPHDPHLPYYILQLFPSSSLCVQVCVFAQRKQRLCCHCAVWCSCVCFRCFHTKDELDRWEIWGGAERQKWQTEKYGKTIKCVMFVYFRFPPTWLASLWQIIHFTDMGFLPKRRNHVHLKQENLTCNLLVIDILLFNLCKCS